MYFYRYSNRGHGICPGCPPVGESAIRGFTVVPFLFIVHSMQLTVAKHFARQCFLLTCNRLFQLQTSSLVYGAPLGSCNAVSNLNSCSDDLLRLLIIGNTGVGKTSLRLRFTDVSL